MKKLIVIALIVWALIPGLSAQDYLFSHWNEAPMALNPALTGHIEEDFRGSLSHRSQWASISNPFVSSFAAYDMPLLRKRTNQNHLGVGGYILTDKAGKAGLQLFQFSGSSAYQVSLNDYNILSTGIQISYGQRSVSLDGLAWDSQYNGVGYDPTLASGEIFGSQKQSYVDVSAGLFWKHEKEVVYSLGYAMWHYGQRQGFLSTGKDELFTKHVAHATLEKNWRQVDITYDLRTQTQAGASEISMGVRGKYRIGMDSQYTNYRTSSAVMAGLFYRLNDALSPALGYEYKRMIHAWLVYDINLSALNVATNYRGGWELHLNYRGELVQKRRKLR